MNTYVSTLLARCCGAVPVLKKLGNLAPFSVRKLLVETLILPKCCILFTTYISAETSAAGTEWLFVNGRYGHQEDGLKLGWLPIIERRQLHFLNSSLKLFILNTGQTM